MISRHLRNVFKENELEHSSTVAQFATVQNEGGHKVERQIDHYNLDAILSVGYRVNSKRGIQFRKWATNILKEHLIKGYSLNQEKLIGERLDGLKKIVSLLSNTLINQNLVNDTGRELIELISSYSKTWDLLAKYDEESLGMPKNLHNIDSIILTYEDSKNAIKELKRQLMKDGAASELFGSEREESLKGIMGNLEQTFGGVALYASLEEKAAHLLYFVIKDHQFNDGNKRIGSLLFLLFLNKAKLDLQMINTTSLTALALLIAESDPSQKESVIKLVINLLN